MHPKARNANLTLLCPNTAGRPRIGRSHRGNEDGEIGECGDAGEWSLYVVASDEERRDEGIALCVIKEQATPSCLLRTDFDVSILARSSHGLAKGMFTCQRSDFRVSGCKVRSCAEVMFRPASQWRHRAYRLRKGLLTR